MVLSLGWGVQSWTLAAMSALGELEPLDLAIHADTGYERQKTYAFAQHMAPWLREHGVYVYTTGPLPQDRHPWTVMPNGKTNVLIPAYTGRGQVKRQCTSKWKIRPLRRAVQQFRKGQPVEMWIGISSDEWQRAKDSGVKYMSNRFPLLELKMSRNDCKTWLEGHSLPIPVKSSCTFCPYHRKRDWQELKREGGPDWHAAWSMDERIRNMRPPALFVHASARPLIEAVDIPEDHGYVQTGFDPDGRCDEGVCWV